ncbi:OmpA family protein [Alkalimarinus coralli]|uniref:OmpA family protein n=1 Tax=Alkalimarinus coralli TaxID=2935863 RepID=UPI00202B552E|nr:OmpA family protein [Alkalimarinus coralli]
MAEEISLEYSIYDYQYDPYYLVYKKAAEDGDVYLAVLIISNRQNTWVLQSIVEEEALEADLVEVSPDFLSQQLEQRGKALLYGVYFDTDKSIVKQESKPSMDAVAELLKTRKQLSLYVVGHTDDSGLLNHNTELSEQRAQAVVKQLVEKYNIESSRLIAVGVGPYAPESTNTSDKGKKLNRRVELVQRL